MYKCTREFTKTTTDSKTGKQKDTHYKLGDLINDSTFYSLYLTERIFFEKVKSMADDTGEARRRQMRDEEERRKRREEEEEEERNRQRNIILNQELLDVSINPDYSTPDPTPDFTPDPTPDNFDYGGGSSGGGGASGDY